VERGTRSTTTIVSAHAAHGPPRHASADVACWPGRKVTVVTRRPAEPTRRPQKFTVKQFVTDPRCPSADEHVAATAAFTLTVHGKQT